MQSNLSIYKTGYGPSSSHTMAPAKATKAFRQKTKSASGYIVELFGSLAATGKGHMTDVAIVKELELDNIKVIWSPEEFLDFHPNAMKLTSLGKDGKPKKSEIAYSVGGGEIVWDKDKNKRRGPKKRYPHRNMKQILAHLAKSRYTFWEYVYLLEGEAFSSHLEQVWHQMKLTIESGLIKEGVLPGGLNIQRKACTYKIKANGYTGSMKRQCLTFAYALATAEQNASGGTVVTAPTCGSAGVVPAVLYQLLQSYAFDEKRIINALATAALVGGLIRANASISGAEVGCQGEIGAACSMAAAVACQLFGGSPPQIEYAASIALEHFLGLTCDPICGLVQVPCIERNALAAARAMSCNAYATLSDGNHFVSFDKVVSVLKKTGHDLPSIYKETSLGGLAVE